MRKESDFIGTVELADDFPFGIHTYRMMASPGLALLEKEEE